MKENEFHAKINIIENDEIKDPEILRQNLIHLYDVINEIAKKLPEEETKNWFYTDEEIEQMKKSGKYNFI